MASILEHTQFVRSKCPIKLLEATAAGAVLLASDVAAYEAAMVLLRAGSKNAARSALEAVRAAHPDPIVDAHLARMDAAG